MSEKHVAHKMKQTVDQEALDLLHLLHEATRNRPGKVLSFADKSIVKSKFWKLINLAERQEKERLAQQSPAPSKSQAEQNKACAQFLRTWASQIGAWGEGSLSRRDVANSLLSVAQKFEAGDFSPRIVDPTTLHMEDREDGA